MINGQPLVSLGSVKLILIIKKNYPIKTISGSFGFLGHRNANKVSIRFGQVAVNFPHFKYVQNTKMALVKGPLPNKVGGRG